MLNSDDVAIYISTMRADYRHAKALLASIETFSSCRNIFIIPDDDYRPPTMFGYPVWRPEDPRVLSLNGFYKKLRVFWGPAARFMHCDADQLVLQDLDPYLRYLGGLPTPFFVTNRNSRVFADWNAGDKELVFRQRAGEPDLLRRFDAAYAWDRWFPFNSGEFSASRDAVNHDELLDVYAEASTLHSRLTPGRPMMYSRAGMFMGDQGFLNYFMNRHCPTVRVQWIEDLYVWGGLNEATPTSVRPSAPYAGTLIHWAGCRRPGPLPLGFGIPRARDWRVRHREYCRSRQDWRGFVQDACDQAMLAARDFASNVKQSIRRSAPSTAL